jgi:hypothetical protein
MKTVRYINSKPGVALAIVAAVVFLIAFDPAPAQSARRGKESVRQSNAIKQYCSAKFRNDKSGRDKCIEEEEAAMKRLDKRGTDPKIKAYCRFRLWRSPGPSRSP